MMLNQRTVTSDVTNNFICVCCQNPIMERYFYSVSDKYWHDECLKCFDCKIHLSERCYAREGQLLCKKDFFRKFGRRCEYCKEAILKEDKVRTVKDKHFHNSCLKCSLCDKVLETGEKLYILEGNQFICQTDLIASNISAPKSNTQQQYTQEEREEEEESNIGEEDMNMNDQISSNGESDLKYDSDSLTKRRGPRTTIKAKQLDILKQAFSVTPKPTRHIREQLAQETGLNMRVIQVWYQNRRSKERRLKHSRHNGGRGGRRNRGLENTSIVPPEFISVDPTVTNQDIASSMLYATSTPPFFGDFHPLNNEAIGNSNLESVVGHHLMLPNGISLQGMAPQQTYSASYNLQDRMAMNMTSSFDPLNSALFMEEANQYSSSFKHPNNLFNVLPHLSHGSELKGNGGW